MGDKVLTYSSLTDITISSDAAGDEYSYTILPFTAIPHGAERIAVCDSNGEVLDSVGIPAEKLLPEEEYGYSFGLLSDIHFGPYLTADGQDRAGINLNLAMQFYTDVGANLVTATGDYSETSTRQHYETFAQIVDGYDIPVLGCGGNHEVWNASLETMYGENGYFRTYMNKGVYDGTLPGVLNVAENGVDFVYRIPGQDDSVFIFLNQRYYDNKSASQKHLVDMSQIDWLTEQFKTYSDKTVFFYFHTYFFDDDGESADGEGDITGPAGGTYGYGYNTYTEDYAALLDLLTQYRNVTVYNGHSHFIYEMQKYNPNLNIFDNEGTTAAMIHIPSLTGPRIVNDTTSSGYVRVDGQYCEGGLVTVYDGYNLMNGVDLYNNRILSFACYITYQDKDGVVTEGTVSNSSVKWTYDAQTQSLRFTGEGAIPDYEGAAAAPWAACKDAVQTIYVGRGITAVGAKAFEGFTGVKVVQIKDGSSIGAGAFALCPAIESLTLPESLETVGKNAFADANALSSLVFEGTDEAFEKVTVEEGNAALKTVSAVYRQYVITWAAGSESVKEAVKAGKSPVYDGTLSSILSEDGTKVRAFIGWTSGGKTYAPGKTLPKATANTTYTAAFGEESDRYVSDTVTGSSIQWQLDRYTGTLSLTGSGALQDFTSEKDTPWYAYASEIGTVEVDGAIQTVGARAFTRLDSLHTVRLGEGVKTLNMDAFAYDSALTTLYLPKSLTTIGQGAFYSSGNVSTIHYAGSESMWNSFTAGIKTPYNDVITGFAGTLICADLPENTDINGDGELTILDVTVLLAYLRDNTTPIAGTGDLTLDGKTNIKDVTRLLLLLAGT